MGDEGATDGEGRCFARGEGGEEEGAIAFSRVHTGPTTIRARGAERGKWALQRAFELEDLIACAP